MEHRRWIGDDFYFVFALVDFLDDDPIDQLLDRAGACTGWHAGRDPQRARLPLRLRHDDAAAFLGGAAGRQCGGRLARPVPVPRPGDRIEIDGDAFLIQGEPVRDRERLVWTVNLRPA
jgi:hypothetical protein